MIGQQHKVLWCEMSQSDRGGYVSGVYERSVEKTGKKKVCCILFLCCINVVVLLFYCVLLFDTGQETVLQFTHKARWQDEIYLGQSTACAAATPCPRKRRQLGLGTSSHAEIKGQSFSRIYIAAPNHGKKNSSTKYVASFTKVYFQIYAQDGHG